MQHLSAHRNSYIAFIILACVCWAIPAHAQELGGAGTLNGTVKDSTGGVMVSVGVSLNNPVSGFHRQTTTDESGKFSFRNVPPNPYHLEITAQGFDRVSDDELAGRFRSLLEAIEANGGPAQ